MSKKLYEDLGVNEDATGDEIKKAYKKSAQENHPDKNDGSEESHEKFNQIRRLWYCIVVMAGDGWIRKAGIWVARIARA